MKKLISFPSEVLWALTRPKSHQRGTKTTMKATGMIFSVPSQTHRQYLYIPLWSPFPASTSCILFISVWVPPWQLCFNSCSSGWTGWAWRCPCLWQKVWTIWSSSSFPKQIILWLLILQHNALYFWYNECHPEPVWNSTGNNWSLKHFHVRAPWKHFLVLGNISFWQPSTELICQQANRVCPLFCRELETFSSVLPKRRGRKGRGGKKGNWKRGTPTHCKLKLFPKQCHCCLCPQLLPLILVGLGMQGESLGKPSPAWSRALLSSVYVHHLLLWAQGIPAALHYC